MALREGGAALRRGANGALTEKGQPLGICKCAAAGRRVQSASAGVGRIERGSEHVCLSHACEVREDERATGGGECESVVCVSEQDGVCLPHVGMRVGSGRARVTAVTGSDPPRDVGATSRAVSGALREGCCYAATRRSRRVPRQGGPRLGPRQARGR